MRTEVNKRNGFARRFVHGLAATALSPVVAAIVQLGSVPLLLHAWGAARYGDWLLLSAVPSYLTFSDLGFGDASGSDMSMKVAAGDRQSALATFQSSWLLVTVVSALALVFAGAVVWWMPWQAWLNLSAVSNAEAAKVLLILGAYVACAQQNGILESGYRSDGNFAIGTFYIVMLRLIETAAATGTALWGGSFASVALAYLLTRCAGTIAYAIYLRSISPWIEFGVRHAHWGTIKRIAGPALGFIAFPLGYAITFQGFTILVGVMLGPVAVVSFSTLRTLSRTILQTVTVIKHALWPELSRAFGEGKLQLARMLHRGAWRVTLALSVLGGGFLWIAGPFLYGQWLHHRIPMDGGCFHILLVVAVANSLWESSAVIPMSTNGHLRIAILYSVAALASLGLARLFTPAIGTGGAAVSLLAADVFMSLTVLGAALQQTGDRWADFAQSLFAAPAFRHVLRQAEKIQL